MTGVQTCALPISAADFEGEPTVTIASVDFTDLEVEGKNGQPSTTERRGALKLAEYPGKPWVSNVTNTKCLIAMFGDENAEKVWPGKRVTLRIERVMSFGEWVPGVRISGSPDLTAPVTVSLKLRKKKAQSLTMQVTGVPKPLPSPPKPTPSAPYDEMWRQFKAVGLTDPKAFSALVKEATGKSKGFDTADVAKFEAALKAIMIHTETP